jgi:hypothetical protein
MQDSEITVGMQVKVQEDQQSAPLNGAIGTVVEIGEFDEAPIYTIKVYGATYRFRAYELGAAE